MEGRVKKGDVCCFRNGGVHRLDDLKGPGIVKWREGRESLQVMVGIAIDSGRLGVGASMNDAVARESDVVGMLKLREVLVRGEVFEDRGKSILSIGDVVELFVFGN